MTDILLEAKGLHKRYGAQHVIDDVSLRLRPREILTIIGPNGSGKTTLIRLLLGLETPDSGTVERRAGLSVGYMPQRVRIDPVLPLSVRAFLMLHPHRHRPDARTLEMVSREAGIAHVLEAPIQDISGGEWQRLLLARALLCEPELLVLDEPVQGVDVTGQAQLYELITRVSRQRSLAVLMVSHDLHLVMSATDEVICLNHHVCCAGHPHAVKSDPAFVALFGERVAESLAVYTHHHTHTH